MLVLMGLGLDAIKAENGAAGAGLRGGARIIWQGPAARRAYSGITTLPGRSMRARMASAFPGGFTLIQSPAPPLSMASPD